MRRNIPFPINTLLASIFSPDYPHPTRTLLVIGGNGNMTGIRADHYPDDMKGLLQGLRNCSQYKQIILYPSEHFLFPPNNQEELLEIQTNASDGSKK